MVWAREAARIQTKLCVSLFVFSAVVLVLASVQRLKIFNNKTRNQPNVFIASMQRLYTPLINTYICVAIDPSNATLSNSCRMRWYKSCRHLFSLVATHICVAKGGVFL